MTDTPCTPEDRAAIVAAADTIVRDALRYREMSALVPERDDAAIALCDAAEAFQSACNDLHAAHEDIASGKGGTPRIEDVEAIYSERFRTLTREIYYMRKAMKRHTVRNPMRESPDSQTPSEGR